MYLICLGLLAGMITLRFEILISEKWAIPKARKAVLEVHAPLVDPELQEALKPVARARKVKKKKANYQYYFL